ncbi:protein phosphatase 1 regulatory subunit 42-like [Penaeus japonicus]|uniref:protein phosphatase 1 regulatory subunit 42-like n=1 Tax=Penaeus japonicus TaxID=27405 RepID=UPI001C7155A9|nr:protein phosphatase 1 regulatory subunit 42-like [Penaeus japonicus]
MVGVNIETLWAWLGDKRRAIRKISERSPPKTIEPPSAPSDELLHPGIAGEEEKEDEGVAEALRLKMKESDEDKEGKEEEQEQEEEEEEAWRKEREALLSRVTHLHLERRGITHIEDVGVCPAARVAFLQHNHLTRLANLRPLRLLQELYLQDNHITRLEGLKELPSLRRLLVGGNRVGVVEGLPHGLQELHIQEQRLPPGDALVLDPHALAAVQDTLLLLDVSGNRMTELGPVGLLNNLKVLRAGNNDLRTLSHLAAVLGRLRHLQEAYFTGNPVTAHRRYRPALILASQPKLENLDGRAVTSYSRDFLVQTNRHRRALRQEKEARPPSPPEASQDAVKPDAHLLFTSTSHPVTTSECATGPMFVLGALRRPEFDLILSRAQRRARAFEREGTAASPGSELEDWSVLDEERFYVSNGEIPEERR